MLGLAAAFITDWPSFIIGMLAGVVMGALGLAGVLEIATCGEDDTP